MNVRYTPEARRDLREIKQYICENLCNPSAAESVTQKIVRSCGMLKTQPGMGIRLSAKTGRNTDLRYIIAGKYIIFYREEKACVSVIRILDTRTDYMKKVFD